MASDSANTDIHIAAAVVLLFYTPPESGSTLT